MNQWARTITHADVLLIRMGSLWAILNATLHSFVDEETEQNEVCFNNVRDVGSNLIFE